MDHLILKFLDVEILESYEIFQVIFYKNSYLSFIFFFSITTIIGSNNKNDVLILQRFL